MAPAPYNDDTWGIWSQQHYTNTATTSSQTVWEAWTWMGTANTTYMQTAASLQHPPVSSYYARSITPEERAEREARHHERERQRGEELKRLTQLRRERDARARELLLEVLDRKQRIEFEKEGLFHVHTKDGERTYRLRPGSPPVRIKGEDGQRWSYCIHPVQSFPSADTAAALKLMIETDEERFLEIANASRA